MDEWQEQGLVWSVRFLPASRQSNIPLLPSVCSRGYIKLTWFRIAKGLCRSTVPHIKEQFKIYRNTRLIHNMLT